MVKSKSALVTKSLNGERFDLAAVALFPDISRKKIKLIIDSGGAYLNKKRIQMAKCPVKEKDKLEIFWEEVSAEISENAVKNKKASFQSLLSENDILFENDQFYVVNKPAGIPSQATLTSSQDSLFPMLVQLNPQKFKLNQLFLVHRLDKETSGVMLVARNTATQKKFEDMFREKKMQKVYDALCYFVPQKAKGQINFPLSKDKGKQNAYFAVTNPQSKIKDAKASLTEYELVEKFKNEASFIRCFPRTGRTHQIRVHLSAIGCPILGDKTYAQNIYGHRFAQIALRHMLHAAKIQFELDGKKYEFEAPWPQDFCEVKKVLEQ